MGLQDIIHPADLFDKIAEASLYIPKQKWNNIDIETFKDFPTSYYRLRIIQSISSFYGIKNIGALYFYPVIYNDREYAELEQKLIRVFVRHNELTRDNVSIDWTDFPRGCYRLLFSYRMEMETFLNQKVYLESNIYQPVHDFINDQNRQFHHLARELSRILGYYVNLHNKHTTVQQLINEYNYPNVDLAEIDAEWV